MFKEIYSLMGKFSSNDWSVLAQTATPDVPEWWRLACMALGPWLQEFTQRNILGVFTYTLDGFGFIKSQFQSPQQRKQRKDVT